MTDTVRLCVAAAFDRAYLCGGWASVRLFGGEPAGFAGGERRTTVRRMQLTGLAAGLRGLPPAVAVRIETEAADAKTLSAILSGAVTGPEDDLDIWAQILTACRNRPVTVAAAKVGPDKPFAFATAWADLSRDKARTKGPFTATIPRTNVTQVSWPKDD